MMIHAAARPDCRQSELQLARSHFTTLLEQTEALPDRPGRGGPSLSRTAETMIDAPLQLPAE